MLLGKIKFANKEYDSIKEVLRAYYYYNTTGNELANYRGKIICLTLEEENEDVSLFENVALQIKDIDIMLGR